MIDHSDLPPVTGATDLELCASCEHPLRDHDAISRRWCAARTAGSRDCICSGSVTDDRVLTHY